MEVITWSVGQWATWKIGEKISSSQGKPPEALLKPNRPVTAVEQWRPALNTDRRPADAKRRALIICSGSLFLSPNATEVTSKPHPSLRPLDALLGRELVSNQWAKGSKYYLKELILSLSFKTN